MRTKFFVIISILLLISSGCVAQSRNLEISSINLIPGKENINFLTNEGTGTYDLSILSFVTTNIGSNTDPGHYSVYARVYDKNGNFVASSLGDMGFSLEPKQSRTIRLNFGNFDPTQNINFNNINLGKIDIIFNYFDDTGKTTNQFIYTKNY
jgi:uncharacterized protein YcfL